MRISRVFLLASLMLWLSPNARAQSPDLVRPPLPAPLNVIPRPRSSPHSDGGSSSARAAGGIVVRQAIRGDGTPVVIHYSGLASEQPWRVGVMKMLAPGIGWATSSHGLLWTQDGGKYWKDITPKSSLGFDSIRDIFFLDGRHGWVLFAKYGEPVPKFDLAATDDTGSTWSITHVAIPENEGNLAAGGRIAFADARHGWMVLDIATSSAFHSGTLVLTVNGAHPIGMLTQGQADVKNGPLLTAYLVPIQTVIDDMNLTNFGPVTTLAEAEEVAPPDQATIAKQEAQMDETIANHPEIMKIPHVLGIRATGTFDKNNRYTGPEIAVIVDKKENVETVKKALPTKLDGIPVLVKPLDWAVDS